MTKFLRLPIVVVLLNIANVSMSAQPSGLYVLDNNQGTYRDANIRSYPFVDGFVWRTGWSDFESSQGVYNFACIDHIVEKLDKINKKLTVLFGAYSVEPSYIAQQPGVTTYQFTDPVSSLTSTRAIPYDAFLLQRFRLFISALANHQVYSISTQTMVSLKNHPVLANIATNIPGLGAIRNVNGLATSIQTQLPDYSRGKFVDSLVVSMKIQTDNFPAKNVFIPSYKNINDNITSPLLANYIKEKLLSTFDGVENPKISFWQENLAGFKDSSTGEFTGLPTTTFATPLLGLGDNAYTMFQMLQGWKTPFLDPAKTANSSPFDAMCYAYNTYGASYYEIYVSDIDNMDYQPSFTLWSTSNCNSTSIVENTNDASSPGVSLSYVSGYFSIGGVENSEDVEMSMFNLMGQNLIRTSAIKNINISSFPSGTYIVFVTCKNRKSAIKFIKV